MVGRGAFDEHGVVVRVVEKLDQQRGIQVDISRAAGMVPQEIGFDGLFPGVGDIDHDGDTCGEEVVGAVGGRAGIVRRIFL